MDYYSKGLEDAAIAAAKTPGIPVSMAYAVAREIWTLWWEHEPIRKHHEKEDPEMVKALFRTLVGLAMMCSRDMALIDENWGVVGKAGLRMTPFYDNIWREWVARPESDPVKQFWLQEAEKFIAGGRGERVL